jgi:hypothetical protein
MYGNLDQTVPFLLLPHPAYLSTPLLADLNASSLLDSLSLPFPFRTAPPLGLTGKRTPLRESICWPFFVHSPLASGRISLRNPLVLPDPCCTRFTCGLVDYIFAVVIPSAHPRTYDRVFAGRPRSPGPVPRVERELGRNSAVEFSSGTSIHERTDFKLPEERISP